MAELPNPENLFPTLGDIHEVLAQLIARGYGALPAQLVVAPDSTLQALARADGAKDDAKPALMIEYHVAGDRMPVMIIATERLQGGGPRLAVQ